MVRRVSARDARARFGDLIGAVDTARETVIVEKKGRPVAVILSLDEFERLRAESDRDWFLIEQLQSRQYLEQYPI